MLLNNCVKFKDFIRIYCGGIFLLFCTVFLWQNISCLHLLWQYRSTVTCDASKEIKLKQIVRGVWIAGSSTVQCKHILNAVGSHLPLQTCLLDCALRTDTLTAAFLLNSSSLPQSTWASAHAVCHGQKK